jgi:hypothetical protein
MEPTETAPPHAPHKHAGRRGFRRAFPHLLVLCLLLLGACAAVAVVVSNGDDGRAAGSEGVASATAPSHLTWSNTVDIPAGDGTSGGLPGSRPEDEPAFQASVPSGPVNLGEPGSLVVTVVNPGERPVELISIVSTVLPPTAQGCLASWLHVDDYSSASDRAVTVPGHGSASVRLAFTLVDLPDQNQDACKGATFALTLTGAGNVT